MEMLMQEAAEVEELVERNQIQERAKVKKTEARQARDRAFEAFDKWLRCAMRTADKV